jgi:ABC-type branched-subunit amino acid transport system substrate-binding protein
MKRKTPLWRLLAVAGAASLVLSACGGDDGDGDEEPGAGADDSTDEPGDAPAEFEGELHLGTLLPQTGNLAFLGPPEFAGVDLAIADINAAGGVGGNDVTVSHTDSGDTSTDIASQSTERLLSEGAAAVIGAASSSVSFTVLDQIVQAETIMFSPANTSPEFTAYDDGGLYFRTAPSDVLQGRVLGDLVLSDGHLDVGVMALQDSYGEGLAENVTIAIEEGGGTVVESIIYDPQAASYSAEVTQMAAADPEAIVLIGFQETGTILPELETQGLSPSDVPLYFVDGNLSNDYAEDLPEGYLEGSKGTLPGAEAPEEFQAQLLEIDSELNDFSYAGESYDATVLLALAAIQAGSVVPRDIADNLVGVSRDGTACTSFAECKELLEAGEDIDYDGVSGPITFSDEGDVTAATIGIYEYGADNIYTNVDYRFGEL